MNKTQEKVLCETWRITDTIDGCQIALMVFGQFEKKADTVESVDTYRDAIDLVFAKGNMMRLVENQKAFVGDL